MSLCLISSHIFIISFRWIIETGFIWEGQLKSEMVLKCMTAAELDAF